MAGRLKTRTLRSCERKGHGAYLRTHHSCCQPSLVRPCPHLSSYHFVACTAVVCGGLHEHRRTLKFFSAADVGCERGFAPLDPARLALNYRSTGSFCLRVPNYLLEDIIASLWKARSKVPRHHSWAWCTIVVRRALNVGRECCVGVFRTREGGVQGLTGSRLCRQPRPHVNRPCCRCILALCSIANDAAP